MIGFLSGILKSVNMTEILVDVGGVGYEVFIPLSTYDRLPKVGEKVDLFIYTHIREDVLQLYGFATELEKKIFKLLIDEVSGIGPKLALNILSASSPDNLCLAISEGNYKALSKINGIGKKTAERMVVELRGKLKPEYFGELVSKDGKKADNKLSKISEEAVIALTQLGFKYDGAVKVVHEIVKETKEEELSTENLIRKALLRLNA